MSTRKYRFLRSDFKPLPVRLNHMDLYLNFADGKVFGTNTLHITAREPMHAVSLDARDIEIVSVEWLEAGTLDGIAPLEPRRTAQGRSPSLISPLVWTLDCAKAKLTVALPQRIDAGERFALRIEAVCVPSAHILEGIYRDTTPPGAPQQYMSQSQQWGFQRILPVFDDCTAKCTMVTTLEADARYTHLISNGNVCRKRNPRGKPVPKPGDPRRQIVTYENFVPMAPYLFIAAAGTWDMLEDEVRYPSGRRVKLQYLVPPGRTQDAIVPMRILKQAVLWQAKDQAYEYKLDTYRTICMEKSNFGGMENLGNTTIITSAALIDGFIDDRRLQYAYGVIPHEFEHNHCGSDVTMETPFDMWLNEAFTVDVERRFIRSQFDPDCQRLDEVDAMRAPILGPLAIEDGGHMGNIVREGFNDPDELVDGVTYVKAAEVIRMLRLLLGDTVFRQGTRLYFRRYDGGNANTDQFFACFEEASGRDLAAFRREWLYTIGYPHLRVSYAYDAPRRCLRVTFAQTRTGHGGRFHVPLEMAAVDAKGNDIPGTARTLEITGANTAITFNRVRRPAFLSINRDCSFYGTLTDASATPEQLAAQIRLDGNRFNRVEAMRRLTDIERIRLIRRPRARVSEAWLEVYAGVLADAKLPPGLRAYLLRIDEQSLNRRYQPCYRERHAARERLLQAVAARCMPALVEAFLGVDTYTRTRDPKDGLEARKLKAVLLRAIVAADTPAAQQLAEAHFRKAWNITDRLSALQCLDLTSHPRRGEWMEEGYGLWKDHVTAYANYLQIAGAGEHTDTFDRIAAEERRPTFHIEHPNHSRALYLPMAANNKLLWTDQGIEWLTRTVIRLATINENTANRLAAAFQLVDKLADDLKPKVRAALRTMRKNVDAARAPSVAGRLDAYLRS